MRYYCKTCKSEFIPGREGLDLPPVGKNVFFKFVDYKEPCNGI